MIHDHFKVIVFVGANQTKLPFEVAKSLRKLGSCADYIKLSGHGSNALDFHIAYYLGRLAAMEPSAYSHIISKNTGFDPLIQHLRSQKILAGSQGIADIAVVKASHSKSPQERIAVILAKAATTQSCEAINRQDSQQHDSFVVSESCFREGGRVAYSKPCEPRLSGRRWNKGHLCVTE